MATCDVLHFTPDARRQRQRGEQDAFDVPDLQSAPLCGLADGLAGLVPARPLR